MPFSTSQCVASVDARKVPVPIGGLLQLCNVSIGRDARDGMAGGRRRHLTSVGSQPMFGGPVAFSICDRRTMPSAALLSPSRVFSSNQIAEFRVLPRYACSLKGTWRKLGTKEGVGLQAEILNVSAGGVGLAVKDALPAGSLLALKLLLPRRRFERPVLVRVLHAGSCDDGRFYAGCAFACKLSRDELDALLARSAPLPAYHRPDAGASTAFVAANPGTLDPFDSGSIGEKRVAPRRRGTSVSLAIARDHSGDLPLEGYVLDLSLGGLGISSPESFEPGTVLNVRVQNGNPATPWVLLRVKNCRAQGRTWKLGCQFVGQPRADVLMLFG